MQEKERHQTPVPVQSVYLPYIVARCSSLSDYRESSTGAPPPTQRKRPAPRKDRCNRSNYLERFLVACDLRALPVRAPVTLSRDNGHAGYTSVSYTRIYTRSLCACGRQRGNCTARHSRPMPASPLFRWLFRPSCIILFFSFFWGGGGGRGIKLNGIIAW